MPAKPGFAVVGHAIPIKSFAKYSGEPARERLRHKDGDGVAEAQFTPHYVSLIGHEPWFL
jgi:hypothetical protein